jgi:hypothetical protein
LHQLSGRGSTAEKVLKSSFPSLPRKASCASFSDNTMATSIFFQSYKNKKKENSPSQFVWTNIFLSVFK